MSVHLEQPVPQPRGGWVYRLLTGRKSSRQRGPDPNRVLCPELDCSSIKEAIRRLVSNDRYAFALLKAADDALGDVDVAPALEALEARMALIPQGMAPIVRDDGSIEPVEIPAFYLDRFAVTNHQFEKFVTAGCYDILELWPKECWPSVMKFLDRSGRPGPAGWENGRPPAGKAQHPVVGVCWYEALAYAHWVGKRLPTSAEWQKAAGWPEPLGGGSCNRYPWGDLFAPTRANLWASGLGGTTAVESFATGDTPNGVRQLAGNVWEWLADRLETIPCEPGERFETWRPLRRIAGGAFDTYLPAEATCQFVTGQPELDRRPNIGFRCALAADALRFNP